MVAAGDLRPHRWSSLGNSIGCESSIALQFWPVSALSQPDRIGARADLAAKLRFQNLVFPEGIEYRSGSGFGTASTACIFSALGLPRCQDEQVVPPTGFEPVSPA